MDIGINHPFLVCPMLESYLSLLDIIKYVQVNFFEIIGYRISIEYIQTLLVQIFELVVNHFFMSFVFFVKQSMIQFKMHFH
jgi:hypothetical protein